MTSTEAKQAKVARIKQALEREPKLMKRQELFKQLWRLLRPTDTPETAEPQPSR